MTTTRARPSGMIAFTIVWLGQLISLSGSAMTRFAITIWAWQLTGEATALALVGFFAYAPEVLLSPIAGALVDRWNRKLVMMLSDLAAGLATVVILLLYLGGHLQVWHLWIAGAFTGAFASFQWPAYSAAISTMIPKEHYARASGMMSLAESVPFIFSPVAAGALIGFLGTSGGFNGIILILAIDVVTFVFAIGALLAVHVPQPAQTEAGKEGRGSLWQESIYGFRYILARPGLLGLQLVFLCGNFFSGLAFTLLAPMILARTQNNSAILGAVNSASGICAALGSLAVSAWGGPKRKTHGVFLGWAFVGLCQVIMGFGLPFWFVGIALGDLVVPTLNASNQAIWQAKVAPDVQGRVFSTRRLIAQVAGPLATLMSGPLADKVFEPAMQPGEPLAASFGWLVGTGPGAGMALIFTMSGVLLVIASLLPYAIPVVRDAEDRLPDHDSAKMEINENEKTITTIALLELPETTTVPGLVYRRFQGEADFPAMSEVINTSNAADLVEETESARSVANDFASTANFDPHQDVIVAEIDGRMAGFSRVRWWVNNEGRRVYWQFGCLRPEWRRKGIGRAMLRYTESRARLHAQANPMDRPSVLQVYAEDTAYNKNALLVNEGYTPVRYTFFMQRKDLHDLPVALLPVGLELRPARPEHMRAIWEAKEKAFQDHWGHAVGNDADYERWLNDPTNDSSLWQIAWDIASDQVAGVSINVINADDNASYNFLRGLVSSLGVRRRWRGRGLGRALLVKSMKVLCERGMTEAVLGVDTENPTGALKLYESVGFRAINKDTIYRKKM
jgi:ribosomal protein S18 acetylase RimI-like enzyme/MFS family permease